MSNRDEFVGDTARSRTMQSLWRIFGGRSLQNSSIGAMVWGRLVQCLLFFLVCLMILK